MTAARDISAEREHHAGQRARLRELLSTGRTYTTGELLKVSSRFGARLLELRRGVDGPALDVRVARLNGKGSDFAYTCVGFLLRPEDIKPDPEALRKRLAVVTARMNRLGEEKAALLESLGGGA